MVTTRSVRLDEKGRLTIPRQMRQMLQLGPADVVFLRLDPEQHTLQLAKAENPFDILAEHAMAEHAAGRTTRLEDVARELGIDLDNN